MENIKCSRRGEVAGATLLPRTPDDRRSWTVWAPWLLYCGVIFYFSSQSRFFLHPPDFLSSDKVYHFLGYTVLGFLTARVARAYRPHWSAGRRLGGTVLFCLLYGLSDEFHQWFVPGRWVSLGDVLADTLGGWAGVRIYAFKAEFETRNPKLKKSQ